eukprot:5256-Karenia_brevis.AAC.1
MRALLAIENCGTGITGVTVWSDSKTVVDGYQKKGRQPFNPCFAQTGRSSGIVLMHHRQGTH